MQSTNSEYGHTSIHFHISFNLTIFNIRLTQQCSSHIYRIMRALKVQGFFICHVINYTGYNQNISYKTILTAYAYILFVLLLLLIRSYIDAKC